MKGRVRLRVMGLDDAKSLFEIYSDKEAMKFRGSKPMETIKDAANYVKNQNTREGKISTIRKGIELVENSELIGSVMFRFDESRKNECEIGYSIGRKYWGRGLGRETVDLLLKDLEQNKEVREIIAWSNKENLASIKILESINFQRIEGKEDASNVLYRKVNAPN